MTEETDGDVFAFPDFSLSAKWPGLPSNLESQFFNLDVAKPGHEHTFISNPAHSPALPATSGSFFNIPEALVSPEDGGLDNENHDESAIVEPLHDIAHPDLDIIDGLWREVETLPPTDVEYKTWDTFSSTGVQQTASLFFTEGGSSVYDAAIHDKNDPLGFKNTRHMLIQTKPYLSALLALSLGRGSVFFSWDAKKAAFTPTVEQMRISGHSAEVLQGLQGSCLKSGSTTRFLSSYVQLTYKTRPSAIRVALAKAVDIILLAIQQKFGECANSVRSMLQLQPLVESAETVLVYLHRLVRSVSRIRTDEQVLSQVFRETEVLENDQSLLRALMCEILLRVTEPWAEFVAKWIGVKPEDGFPMTKDGPGKSFVKVEDIDKVDDLGIEFQERDYLLDEGCIPAFIPIDVATVMFEAGKILRLLRAHHPEHTLCHVGAVASSHPPDLKWRFDWKSIESLQSEVRRYKEAMLLKIVGESTEVIPQSESEVCIAPVDQSVLQVFGNDGSQLEKQLQASIQELDKMPSTATTQDTLSALLDKHLFDQGDQIDTNTSDLLLHWSVIPLHSFGPLVMTQARLVNREYMKFLFDTHNLEEHLAIQKEFQLLGNGMFCSRLSHALFDPDLDTAERRTGVALNGGIMGLRMNGRDTWPPASSELRLALMGILSETYTPRSSQASSPPSAKESKLPGDLSFGLRDLPADEIDKCMDPTSLEALDFLRLTYKTPTPLSPILTPIVLVKYDKIFKVLLRILRMLYVVGQVFRDTSKTERLGYTPDTVWLRFRFEAQHFVQSVATYFFDTGIQMPWSQFEEWLNGVRTDLARADLDTSNTRVVSPDGVREEHEKMLDRMMNILLLRKRQQPVAALLDEIFSLILRFSRQVQLEVGNKVEAGASRAIMQELYKTFRKKMVVFVTVCHGLSEKAGAAGKSTRRNPAADGERREDGGVTYENTIDRLLINLDMFNYYSCPRF